MGDPELPEEIPEEIVQTTRPEVQRAATPQKVEVVKKTEAVRKIEPEEKKSPKVQKKVEEVKPQRRVERDEPSFIDTFPSKLGRTSSIDDRPIRPQKNPQYGGVIDLDTIPEKSSPAKVSQQKQFLRKKKVYDPKEAIMKEKECKRKNRSDKPSNEELKKEPAPPVSAKKKPSPSKDKKVAPKLSQLGKSRSERADASHPISNFANMDKQQRIQKISQLLRQNRP